MPEQDALTVPHTEPPTSVKAASPQFFENLVVELLLKMDYGGSRRREHIRYVLRTSLTVLSLRPTTTS